RLCVPGSVNRRTAVVNLNSPSAITVQPTASQSLCEGSPLSLSVTATGTGLSYQWYRGVTAVGVNSNTYTVGAVAAGDAGTYTVQVTSSGVCVPATVTSANAVVNV